MNGNVGWKIALGSAIGVASGLLIGLILLGRFHVTTWGTPPALWLYRYDSVTGRTWIAYPFDTKTSDVKIGPRQWTEISEASAASR